MNNDSTEHLAPTTVVFENRTWSLSASAAPSPAAASPAAELAFDTQRSGCTLPAQPREMDSSGWAAHAPTPEVEKPSWSPPPIPPIPTDQEEEAWRRRSSKRQSYTSQWAARASQSSLHAAYAAEEEKAARPISQVSVTSTVEVRNGGLGTMARRKPEPDAYGELHWEINALNPRAWRRRKKWTHTLIAAVVTFTVTFASAVQAPTYTRLEEKYGVGRTIATMPYSLFLVGLGVGTLINKVCGLVVGRKVLYVVFLPLFAALTVAAAFVEDLSGISVCRLMAGVLGGSAMSQEYDVVTEIWAVDERTPPLLFSSAMPLLGPLAGRIIGADVLWLEGYRWTQYVILFAFAGCVVPAVCMSETSRASILSAGLFSRHEERLGLALLYPMRMLFRPTVFFLSLYSSVTIAILYLSLLAFPRIFSEVYVFKIGSQGLTYTSMLAGLAIGMVLLVLNHKLIYSPRLEQWQAQRAAEAEKARRRHIRSTVVSNTGAKSGVSNFSRPTLQRPETSRSSVARSWRPGSAGGNAKGGVASRPSTAIADRERNSTLAVAAAKYLNGVPANDGRRILAERIMLLLANNPPFGDLCVALEEYQLRFDKVQLAKVLVDALPSQSTIGEVVAGSPSALAESKSLHRYAAAATLDTPSTRPSTATTATARPREMVESKEQRPPAGWRLWVTLPASILMPASMFIFAWTARNDVHWIAPCVGMGIFAFSALVIVASSNLYLGDCFKEKEGANAIAGGIVLRYLLSFAFSMFALPMYDRLGAAWATTLFGFIGVGLGVVPWVLVFKRRQEPRGR